MKSLKELQDEFQRGILAGDDTILAAVNDSAKEQKKILFGVYRNAYVARLAEILGEDYEQVHAYLGDQGFARLVKSYIAANPSDQRSARWFGRHLPAYVRGSTAYPKHAEVAELAELEKIPSPHLRNQRGRCLDRAQERERSTETHSPARTTGSHRLGARLHGALQAAFHRGSDDVGRGCQGGALRCPVRDGGTFAGEDGAELRAASYLKGWVDTGLLTGFQLQ
jgi:hypothetical protein